jgi:dGTPase
MSEFKRQKSGDRRSGVKSVYDIAAEVNQITTTQLSPYATKDEEAVRKYREQTQKFRPPFALDRDRIIYSGAFRRYTGKTQVVYFASLLDEQLSSRSIHTLSVAQIARTIGRLLRLNIDLIEAIALGHDLGHPPFGHDGELYLSRVSERHGIGCFCHNVQSLRVVDQISKRGRGLNLTLQVREGLLSHDGEVHDQKLVPTIKKKEVDLTRYIKMRETGDKPEFIPMTMEGCVVRLCDTIAYIGQDIEDAIRLNLIKRGELPRRCVAILGSNNGAIIETLVRDMVENSYQKKYIAFSQEISEALQELKRFNYNKIYKSARLKVNHARIARGFELMFTQFLHDVKLNNRQSPIFRHFLNGKVEKYVAETSHPLQVRDYIAGMTDRYFAQILKELLIPEVVV